ncbi:hypothetical protein [Paenarthrobacter nitroguajacolicus]|uniref:hypothetical protein n=1 Tax=Paenarthrobacter nitroguajacolicus TaxID=211146 RepID=UPI0015BD31A5|nr:hypothetical protein [Paenarthrobacter nitroguajacolicus]NWL12680.1 hypothetical protein [Paenarthrobacter nitroguajacolicus]NWL35652.1 hypothetical protein [Paenarthrobacter nitroguajacolicus]
MIGSLASFASTVGTTIAAWIEAAYVLDCRVEEDAEGPGYMSNLVWLPALSGVTVASAQAIQANAGRAGTGS